MSEIMSPDHPLWDEFCDRLGGPEGCNFREDDKGKLTWNCGGGNDKSKSRAILIAMACADVEESLAYFVTQGGYCDCEVLFNLADEDDQDDDLEDE